MQPQPSDDLAFPAPVETTPEQEESDAIEVRPFEILTPGKAGTGFKDFTAVVTSAEEDEVVDPKGSSVLALVEFSDTVPELDSDLAGSSLQAG